ncbi:hypothetical protein VZT92_024019 [Zoarces viviparus]
MKLDIEDILQKAEGICQQIKSCKDLPCSISVILGLGPGPDPGVDSEVCDCGASPSLRPTQRPDVCSNGLLRGSSSHNRVAFISS